MSPEPSAAAQAESFALTQGLRDTRGAFERWRADPPAVLGPWFVGAVLIACGLLGAVWVVSLLLTPDLTPYDVPGLYGPMGLGDMAPILGRNLLVLALHATACVAGFIAGSSMRQVAETKTGISRVIHERAGPIAIAWVIAVTCFSLLTQSLALGLHAATISHQLGISSALLVLTVLPHALLELTAVFLPLAAWLIASRRDEWGDLLAATFVTVAIALPMLLAAAFIEVTWWPRLLEMASPVLV